MTATLQDKITLVPVLSFCLGKALLATATGPFRHRDAAPTYRDHVVNTLVRELCVRFTYGHYSILLPQFLDSYTRWCHKHKIKPDVVDVPNTNIKGFWIGSRESAQYQMVFYHGGGFVITGTEQHLKMVMNFVKWADGRLAVFCVCYTLAPEAVYPTQLGQAVEALRYALTLPGRSPENTLIGGDSAGGNLVLALTSHISGHQHPRTDIVRPLDIKSNLKGALAIAPWTSSDKQKYESMQGIPERDIITNVASHYWLALYRGEGETVDDIYIAMAHAEADWWQGSKIDHMLCTAGGNEILLDSIVDFAEKYRSAMGSDRIHLVVGEHETHDAPLDSMPESKIDRLGESCQEGGIRNWIRQQLL